MKAIILQFPKPPCLEKWESMNNNDLGKHCPVCKTDIFDFSDLTDDELVEILKHAPAKVCGKFRASQIGRPILIRENKPESKNPRFKKMLAATVLLAVSTPFLNAQDTLPLIKAPMHVIDTVQPIRELNATEQDTLLENDIITGIVYYGYDSEPINGASVWVKGNKKAGNGGTITNDGGKFRLPISSIPKKYIKKGMVKLEFSYIGCKSQIVEVNVTEEKIKPLKIYLEDDGILLGEVIITLQNDFYDPIYGR